MSINDDAKTYIGVRYAKYLTDPDIDAFIQIAVDLTADEEFQNGYMAVGLRAMHLLEKKKSKDNSSGGPAKRKKEGDVEIEYAVSVSSSSSSGSSGTSWTKIDLSSTTWGRELVEMIATEVKSDIGC